MRALQLPRLALGEIPRPAPRAGEILIRVSCAGVTAAEVEWYPTLHTREGGERTGAVPCHEFSGTVAETGPGVAGVSVGDAVYGMNDWFADGALAEYCISRPEWVAAKPAAVSDAEAAAVPIAALTAWQGLYERARMAAGERVLIQGASGGVGVFAVQLARLRGARITATASADKLEFLRELGADAAVDYRTGKLEIGGFDVVFDAVGGETLRRSWELLRPGGRMVTIASDGESELAGRDKEAFFIVEPNGTTLAEISGLLAGGSLRPFVGRVLPFADAAQAFGGGGRTRGKTVVQVG